MIRRSDCMVSELKENEQGGKGVVEIKHIYKPEDIQANSKLFAVITLNPGCSIGLHQHVDEDEIFYIIRGKALIVDDGKKELIGTGDSHLIKSGLYHSIENIEKEPLEVLAVILPY